MDIIVCGMKNIVLKVLKNEGFVHFPVEKLGCSQKIVVICNQFQKQTDIFTF